MRRAGGGPGAALLRLEGAVTELRERFDISPEEFNLDLGPLLPRD